MGIYVGNCYRGKVVYWYEPSRRLIQVDVFGSLPEVIADILTRIEDNQPFVITIVNEDVDICIEDKVMEYMSFEELTEKEIEELKKELKEKYKMFKPVKANVEFRDGKKYLVVEIGD